MPEFALVLFALTMTCLAEMHDCGVLHNNLNSANLLFDEDLHPTCMDFEYAKMVRGHPNGQEFIRNGKTGAPCYAAPELARFWHTGNRYRGCVSTKGDVYAAAAVLFHGLFASNHPISETKPVNWEEKVQHLSLSQPHPANQLVLDLYRECLQRDPQMRPSAAQAVLAARQCASWITLSHFNCADYLGPFYLGRQVDWMRYDWTAEEKWYSSSLQAWKLPPVL